MPHPASEPGAHVRAAAERVAAAANAEKLDHAAVLDLLVAAVQGLVETSSPSFAADEWVDAMGPLDWPDSVDEQWEALAARLDALHRELAGLGRVRSETPPALTDSTTWFLLTLLWIGLENSFTTAAEMLRFEYSGNSAEIGGALLAVLDSWEPTISGWDAIREAEEGRPAEGSA